jgi:hypothetical protein
MLPLMWARRIQDGHDAVCGVDSLVYTAHFGENLFAVDDDERQSCLYALLTGRELRRYDATNEPKAYTHSPRHRLPSKEYRRPDD